MGFMDAINPEDRIDIKFGDFYALVKNSTRAELMMNGIKNKIDHDAIYTMMKGEHLPEPCEITSESEDK